MMQLREALLDGPRGRRLCLEAAMDIEPEIRSAVFWLAYDLDPGAGSSRVIFPLARNDVASARPTLSIPDFTALLAEIELNRVDDRVLQEALRRSVDSARYWQQPDGEDVLSTDPRVRSALRPVAERVAALAPHLWAGPQRPSQWLMEWHSNDGQDGTRSQQRASLQRWRTEQREEEERAARERPTDPTANWSGSWWSIPLGRPRTVNRIPDGFDLIEDSMGWDEATALPINADGRTLEIQTPDDWVDLCRRFPLEVTASQRHDWYRVTGADRRWVIPDWQRVAEAWDAAHLTVPGYLAGATRLLELDAETATVIAGWDPGSTIWLTDPAARDRDSAQENWRRDSHGVWRQSA